MLPYNSQINCLRDLGTEGAEDADMALRKCITLGMIPGPRYLCASRAIVATGSYGVNFESRLDMYLQLEGPKNQQRPYITEVDGKAGADSASGSSFKIIYVSSMLIRS
jgi:hypothetical protein